MASSCKCDHFDNFVVFAIHFVDYLKQFIGTFLLIKTSIYHRPFLGGPAPCAFCLSARQRSTKGCPTVRGNRSVQSHHRLCKESRLHSGIHLSSAQLDSHQPRSGSAIRADAGTRHGASGGFRAGRQRVCRPGPVAAMHIVPIRCTEAQSANWRTLANTSSGNESTVRPTGELH